MDAALTQEEVPTKFQIFMKKHGLQTLLSLLVSLIGAYIAFSLNSRFQQDQGMNDRVNKLSVEKADTKYVDAQDEVQRRLIDQNRTETYNTFQELRNYIQEQNKENTRLIIDAIKTKK